MVKNPTGDELRKMGLVENEDGSYSVPRPPLSKKMAAKVKKIEKAKAARYQGDPRVLDIPSPPTFYMIDGTKYYLTANVFFASHHWRIRKKITTWAKKFLHERMLHLKPLKARTTLLVVFSVKREITPKMNFDIDNRGYFWGKMFQDVLEDLNLVLNDNTYWISKVHYEFDWKRKEDNLTFKIL